MPGISIGIGGLFEASRILGQLAAGCEHLGAQNSIRQVGSELPYAYGIEYGHHPDGRLARAAGPAYYLRDAYATVGPEYVFDIASRMGKIAQGHGSPSDVSDILDEIAQGVMAVAKSIVPIKSGRLRSSIQVYKGRGNLREYISSGAISQYGSNFG